MFLSKKAEYSPDCSVPPEPGSRKETTTADTDSCTEYASTGGSLTLLAGQNLNLHASDLAAAQDIRLSAANIPITAGENLLNIKTI